MERINYGKYAPIFLRISLSAVFLWFGYASIFKYELLLGYLPSFTYSIPLISLREILFINGLFEIVFGLALLAGFYTRVSALLLSLHTLSIAYSLGYNDIAIRDLGIALATFAVFLNGEDEWCLDRKLKRNRGK